MSSTPAVGSGSRPSGSRGSSGGPADEDEAAADDDGDDGDDVETWYVIRHGDRYDCLDPVSRPSRLIFMSLQEERGNDVVLCRPGSPASPLKAARTHTCLPSGSNRFFSSLVFGVCIELLLLRTYSGRGCCARASFQQSPHSAHISESS